MRLSSASFLRPTCHPRALPSVIPAPLLRHSCAGRNPPTPTPTLPQNSSLPPLRGEVRWGWNVANQRRRPCHTPITRATPPSPPRHLLRHARAPFRHARALPSVIPAQAGTHPLQQLPQIHPSLLTEGRDQKGAGSLNAPRTNLNIPEQIRTNLNTANHPDQIGPPKIHPEKARKKTNPNTAHRMAGMGRRKPL